LWVEEIKTGRDESHIRPRLVLLQRVLLVLSLLLIAASLIAPVYIFRYIRVVSGRLEAVSDMNLALTSLSIKAQRLYGRGFNRISRDSFLETSRTLKSRYRWLVSLYGDDEIPGNLRDLWDFTEPYISDLSENLNSLDVVYFDIENRSLSNNEFAILDDGLRQKLGEGRYADIRLFFHNLIFFSIEIVPQYSRALQSAIVSLNQEKQSAVGKLVIPVYLVVAALILFIFQALLNHFSEQRKEMEEAREKNRMLEDRVGERTAELTAKNRMLEEAKDLVVEREKMAALGQLVAGLAHEMNTPLGIAVTASSYVGEVVSRDNPESEIVQMSSLVISNLNKVSKLLDRFKNLAVINEAEIHRSFDLMDYLRNYIIPSLMSELEKRSLRLTLEGPENLKIRGIFGDYSQIIIQLIENCIQHGYEDSDSGEIRITVDSNETGVRITVADDGKGIDEDAGAKIYEPFFTTGRSHGGIGLGLTLVYNIVNHKLGGNIGYQSVPGEGTTVTVFIPFI